MFPFSRDMESTELFVNHDLSLRDGKLRVRFELGLPKTAAQAGMQAHMMPIFISITLLKLSVEARYVQSEAYVVKAIRGVQ